jgi:hypothetical protein
VTDELQQSKIFDLIATPSEVRDIILGSGFNLNIKNLTQSQRISCFRKICEGTKKEALIVFEDLGLKYNNKQMFSFKRGSRDFKGKILIFELQSDQIIFSSITEMKINQGKNVPNRDEIASKIGKTLAQKIVELKTAQTIAQK